MAFTLKRGLGALAVAAGAALVLLTAPTPGFATGGAPLGTVSSPVPLKVRAGASTGTAPVGALRTGIRMALACQQVGQWVRGRVRDTNLWDRLPDGRYVSDAYVLRDARVKIASCGAAAPPGAPTPGGGAPAALWAVPLPGRPGQGFRPPSNPFHQGVDIMEPRGTAVRAAAAGVVATVTCNTSETTCDVDGSPSVRGCGWYAEIQHPGGVVTRYCHLIHQPVVAVGQAVAKGQVIGYVGTSGNSSAPHLHFEVHQGVPANPLNAVDPVAFMRAAGAPLGGPS